MYLRILRELPGYTLRTLMDEDSELIRLLHIEALGRDDAERS